MRILVITKTLSEKNGPGRYSLELLRYLARNNELTVLTSEVGDIGTILGSGISVFKIPNLSIGKVKISSVIEYFFIVRKYSRNQDLIHFFTDFPNYLIFTPLLFFRSKSYFITAHGTYAVSSLDHKFYRPLISKVYQRAKKIVCVSKFTQEAIIKRLKINNTVVINNGVDFEKFYHSIKDDKDNDEKIIVGVGAIKNRKGYDIAIKAVGEAVSRFPGLKYYIIGDQSDGVYFDYLKEIIKSKNLQENIIFLENVTDQKLINLYQKADLFLLTPVVIKGNKFEGFGLVYLEASASGLPVIGTTGCGAEDAIKNGYNGFLVPPGDIKATAEAISKILGDKSLSSKFSFNGQKWAKTFDWQIIAQRYQDLYDKKD